MQPTDDPTSTNQSTDRRVTVSEAATLLGISEDAVRSRLKRGTLGKDKGPNGTVLVVLGRDGSADRPSTNQPTDQRDLVEVLRDQVAYLREQLDQEREANRENRRILAGLVQRVPELEPAAEPPNARQTPGEGPDRVGGPAPNAEEPDHRPSWWRRIFGG
jgi:hypothetical protein